MEAKINRISIEMIKPSSPTPNDRKQLKLSMLDQFGPESYLRPVFFFQNQSPIYPTDPSETTLHLKKSLSECLTKFYPLAGKLNEDHVSVDCDDSGVLFVEAKVDAPLLQALHRATDESFAQYLPFDSYPDLEDGELPETFPRNEILVAVQISWFECGGTAIGVCITHRVADVPSMVAFMNSWASINRGESIKFLPNFDIGRNLFPPGDVPFESPPIEVKETPVARRFLFTKEKLMELKELAISSSSSSSPVKDPTRVEVVTAFLMNQFMKVTISKKNIHLSAATKFEFWHAVNLRSRISSPMQAADNEFPFGNFAAGALVSFSPSDGDHFSDIVSHTRTAIREVNYDYVVKFLIPFMNNMGTSASGTDPQPATETTIMMMPFASWCRSSMYEVDFGWGNPKSVAPAGTSPVPVTALTSTENEDAIEARIATFEDEFALFSDELLSLEITGLNF